jgi:hypothetical protein
MINEAHIKARVSEFLSRAGMLTFDELGDIIWGENVTDYRLDCLAQGLDHTQLGGHFHEKFIHLLNEMEEAGELKWLQLTYKHREEDKSIHLLMDKDVTYEN